LRTCFAGGVVATSFHTQCAPLLRQVLTLLIRFSHKSNPKMGVFLTKFTISADFGHHAANFTESMQPQAFGWQNDDKNDDR
ncbi:MAG: hypothetical protein SO294_01105, partial [Prevotella sp.]|nr:hypothetical protein [Prevotella sp.]